MKKMKKFVLTAVALLTLSAACFAEGETTADTLKWKFENDTLKISGEGAMPDYPNSGIDFSQTPWSAYRSSITTVVIEEGVTSIGNNTFKYYTHLTSVTVPETLTSIGNYAFYNCQGLTSISIGKGVTSIGDRAFYNCKSLTSVTIPENVTSIGDIAFNICKSLTDIVVETGNEYYSSLDGVLFDKAKTTLICCPAGKKEADYTIPESVTSIGNYAFSNCSSLTSITIPNSVTSIGSDAFNYCKNLISVTIPEGVTSIKDFTFSVCSRLTSITIPESVISIEDNAFSWCSNLTSITIPEGVTSIGNYVFSNCSSLTSITIPESLTSIGINAFLNCSSLTSITILEGVTSIGDYAFVGCSSLTSVINLNPIPQELKNVFIEVDLKKATLYVPFESVEIYKIAEVWKEFGEILPYGTGIEYPAAAGNVRIYPNPIAESFSIDGINAPVQVTVTDLSGRTVLTQIVGSGEPVAVGHLPQGVYFVNINGTTVKVIKQ
jgi:hypothetical protein